MEMDKAFKNKKKYKFFTATRLIVLGFMLIILVGAALLMCPCAHKTPINFLDALFTATSATCVTGLSVFDISDTFTAFGHVIILGLIQLGGIGFMTLTSFIYLVFSKRIGLSVKLTLNEDVTSGNASYIRRFVGRILLVTFLIESVGMILLSIGFSKYMPVGEAIWNGLFHSVSAFCNAGFDIITLNVGQSMMTFNSDPLIQLTLAFLIILGGIGFLVLIDIFDAKRWRKFRLHTKVVLTVNTLLILLGTFSILGIEFNNPNTMGNMNGGDKLLNSFFQAVSARTAGFNTVDISQMESGSIVVLNFLMFIGASPGSTGGGVKTTTLFILMVTVISVIRQRRYAVIDKQNIGSKTVHKAAAIFMLALTLMVSSVFIMTVAEGPNANFEAILFEQISAYATVGLSFGITSSLTPLSLVILIINMFVGRVGVLTFFISLRSGKDITDAKIKYPECSVDM